MNVIKQITSKSLRKNKTRTLVTIIGVILSLAMITGVTTFVSSLQAFLINATIDLEGNWHVRIQNTPQKDMSKVQVSNEIESYTVMQHLGYSYLEGGQNEYKPYLYLVSFNEDTFKAFSLKLTEGRLPQNDKEIVVPNHTYTNGGVKFGVGDTITLDIGQRKTADGFTLNQSNPYIKSDNEEDIEVLEVIKTETFKVVGICERPGFESYMAPGYTVITYSDSTDYQDGQFDLYFNVKRPSKIYEVVEGLDLEGSYLYHNGLLRFMGVSSMDSFNSILYSLGAILLLLIMIGSISLIYNSFSISVSERKKQYGLLSGAGATTKQLKSSVFYEALFISSVGVPIGILSGILGIGVTLYLLEDVFKDLSNASSSVKFVLSVSPASIIIAAIAGVITILISAYIPARRCAKMSAMDAIRQVTDIKMKQRHVKTWRLTRKVFGFEGDLALKNIKRNRRKYRSTVISLFISIVLFISASSFSSYMMDSVTTVYRDLNYDLSYHTGFKDGLDEKTLRVYEKIIKLDAIDKSSIINNMYGSTILKKEFVDHKFYNTLVENGLVIDGHDANIHVTLYYVDDNALKDYLGDIGEDYSKYFDSANPYGIVIDRQQYFDYSAEKMVDHSILNQKVVKEINVYPVMDGELEPINISIGKIALDAPIGINNFSDYNSVTLIISESVKDSLFSDYKEHWNNNLSLIFTSEDPFKASEDITKILLEEGLSITKLTNYAELLATTRNTVMVMKVFSYGFIILISLITVANVFNTISTNMELRTREFAMLRSVGMTSKGFRKMINFESIFYGIKALMYGVPVAILITYLIYSSLVQGMELNFYIPLSSVLITVVMVFAVVFATMMYSVKKIGKQNILDGLRMEK